jgi:hypothetical protein
MKKSKSVNKKTSINRNYHIQRKGKYLLLIKSNGKIKSKKLYNKKTYSHDIENAKYHQNFKEYKKETNYGKRITYRGTKRTQKFYNYEVSQTKIPKNKRKNSFHVYNSVSDRPKYISQRTIDSNKEYFIVYCEGYLKHHGRHINISASSHRYSVNGDVSYDEAKDEATENFYRIAYGKIIGTVSDLPPESYPIEDMAFIERYYISYKDKSIEI